MLWLHINYCGGMCHLYCGKFYSNNWMKHGESQRLRGIIMEDTTPPISQESSSGSRGRNAKNTSRRDSVSAYKLSRASFSLSPSFVLRLSTWCSFLFSVRPWLSTDRKGYPWQWLANAADTTWVINDVTYAIKYVNFHLWSHSTLRAHLFAFIVALDTLP